MALFGVRSTEGSPPCCSRSSPGSTSADYDAATEWYVRLLGHEPRFIPNDTEAAWERAEHRSIYIAVHPVDAGHSVVTVFVDDLDERVAGIAGRGIEPAKRETYDNGVGRSSPATRTAMRSASAERLTRRGVISRPIRERRHAGPGRVDSLRVGGPADTTPLTTIRDSAAMGGWRLLAVIGLIVFAAEHHGQLLAHRAWLAAFPQGAQSRLQ